MYENTRDERKTECELKEINYDWRIRYVFVEDKIFSRFGMGSDVR